MSRRSAAWLAWSVLAVCVVLIALALLLDFLTDDVPVPDARTGFGLIVLAGVLSLAFPTVGALIASRLPANPIGWIFCCAGLVLAMQRFTIAYADYALLENFALPWGESVAWFSSWVWFANPILLVFLLLLFPSGRLASRRWRIVAWVALLGAALIALADAFIWRTLPFHPWVYNPFGVVGATGGVITYQHFVALNLVGNALVLTSILAALLSLILRLLRARGDERQQIKWFLYPVVPAVVFLSVTTVHLMVYNFTEEFLFSPVYILPSWAVFTAIDYVSLVAALVIPVCTYIAILRYRLYDIDVVINRALVYGSLTTMLALIYFGGIATTEAIFRTLTGQEEQQPHLAIVVSTLVIAALFNPLRRRIQAFIDRRFYRRKYDAAKTLEAFSAKLRDETDLDALSDDLVGVVKETMQPAHVSLWLRPELPPRESEGQE
jgi:hypothetical protein